MFDKFGEFDSYEELNRAADGFLAEGDLDSLKAMAEENGLSPDDTEDYISGDVDMLSTQLTAALGKIAVEEKVLKPKDIMLDWVNYIQAECMDQPELAAAVRRKGKTVKGCIGALLKWAFSHQITIDKDILDAAGVKAGKVTLGMPGYVEARKIIRKYYLGGAK